MLNHKCIGQDKSVAAGEIIVLIFFCVLLAAGSQSIPEDKVNSLIKKLQSKTPHTRVEAVKELGKIKDPRTVPSLINALKDTDAYVRGQAAWILGEMKDVRAVQPLLTILKEDDYLYVRQESLKALGKIKDVRAVQPLMDALKDENPEISEEAATALIGIGAPATEPLNRALKEHNLRVVADTYYFLICLGEPGTETILVDALNKYGTKRMSMDFINCGNIQLKEAAKQWSEKHNYKMKEGIEAGHGPKWEKFRSLNLHLPR
jgi:HEAT repeats